MQTITLLLEQDEIAILRSMARTMEIMLPETHEVMDKFIDKILKGTDGLNPEYRKDIGKMQRALRKIKQTDEYDDFMVSMNKINKMIVKEYLTHIYRDEHEGLFCHHYTTCTSIDPFQIFVVSSSAKEDYLIFPRSFF